MNRESVFDRRWIPPLALFSGAAIGLILGRWLTPDPMSTIVLALALAGAGALATRRETSSRLAPPLLWVALAVFAAGWWTQRVADAPARPVLEAVEAMDAEGRRPIVAVVGVVAEAPEVRPTSRGPFARYAPFDDVTLLRLSGAHLEGASERAPAARFIATVAGSLERVRAGDLVRVSGRLAPAGRVSNPGEPPYRLTALERGLVGFLSVPSPGNVEVIERRASARAWAAATLRERATAWLPSDPDDPAAALLRAVIIGERTEALEETDAAVRRIGVAHLLAVSGLHLTFLVMLGVWTLRLVGDPGRAQPIVAAGLILLYLTLTPAKAPIVRAAVVALALLAGEATGARWGRVALLAIAATLTVFWRPLELWNPGFQLSYGCVAALVIFHGPVARRLRGDESLRLAPRRFERTRRAVFDALLAAVIAWVVATPILAHHVGLVNPLGPLAVVVTAPVFSLALALGFAASLLSVIWPGLAAILAPLAEGAAGLFLSFVHALDAIPLMSVYVPEAPIALTIFAIAAGAWALSMPRRRVALAGSLAALTLGASAWLWHAERREGLAPEVALRIDMLDVGDGTCVLVRSGGESILWDLGSRRLTLGRRLVPDALRDLGAWGADEAMLTHANLDHFAGFPDAAGPLGLDRVRTTPDVFAVIEAEPDGPEALLVDLLHERGARLEPVAAPASFTLGETRVRVLWPMQQRDAGASDNNRSLVLELTVDTAAGERVALLTGDIEPEAADAILRAYPNLRADVLELPHHGSARLAGRGFVEALDPRVVLQSSGRSRLGDERWDAAREGRVWLMTAEVGAAWAEIDRSGAIRHGAVRLGE